MQDILTIRASNALGTQPILVTLDASLHQKAWEHIKALVELGVYNCATNGSEFARAPFQDEIDPELL